MEWSEYQNQQLHLDELVSIIIVSYNYNNIGLSLTRNCLKWLLKNTIYPNFEVIVVNYGSKEKLTIDELFDSELLAKVKRVVILNTPHNIGYSGANNIALKQSRGRFVVLLNNDTRVTKGWLWQLYRTIKVSNDNVAAVQSKLLLMDFTNRIDSVGHVINPIGFLRAKGYLERDQGQYDRELKICVIQPAACIIRRDVLKKIGLFDSMFFWGHEDTDFSLRARICGYELILEPKSIVYHKRSATISRMPEEFVVYYSRRNILLTMLKTYQVRTLIRVLPLHLFVILIILMWYLWNRKYGCFLAVIRALFWIMRNFKLVVEKRRRVQQTRKISDRELFRVMDKINFHYLLRARKYGSLTTLHLELAERLRN